MQIASLPTGVPVATDSFLFQRGLNGALYKVSTLGGPDYEEGTFTPILQGTTLAGVGTYLTQQGEYIKKGKEIFISIWLNWSAHTGTGEMRIANIPFPTDNLNYPLSIEALRLTHSKNFISLYLSNNSQVIFLKEKNPGSDSTGIPIASPGIIFISGSFITS